MNLNEAMGNFRAHRAELSSLGVHVPDDVQMYTPDEFKRDYALAMDALPTLVTDPSGGIPAILTTMIDPEVFRIVFAPLRAAEIWGGEVQRGSWVDDTILFPVVEAAGEVSSYGDWNQNGRAGVNMNWPARQSYLFQTMKEYGEREMDRAGLGRINYVSELDKAAARILSTFLNYTYFFGVAGQQNYGSLNDPNLAGPLTPAPKAWGGTAWISGGIVRATANEIYSDIQALYLQLVAQTGGLVDQSTPMVLAMSPTVQGALTTTNSFGVNVTDLLKKNFPNLRVETAVQYGALGSANPQGIAAGNFMQLIANEIEGQKTGFPAYNEKMRNHPVIRRESSFRQKVTSGTWGTVIRMPLAVDAMVGM